MVYQENTRRRVTLYIGDCPARRLRVMSLARLGLLVGALMATGCAETSPVCEARLIPINPGYAAEIVPPPKASTP